MVLIDSTAGLSRAKNFHFGVKPVYDEMTGPNGEIIFESYAQNNNPGAYCIFWFYGPVQSMITVLAVTPHP